MSISDNEPKSAIAELIRALPSQVVVAIVLVAFGFVIAVISAAGGGVFGIPAGSIGNGLQVFFIVVGGVITLAAVLFALWTLWSSAAKDPRPRLRGKLSLQQPEATSVKFQLRASDKSHDGEKVVIQGVLPPGLTGSRVWILRRKVRVTSQRGRDEIRNETFVYPAQVIDGKQWSATVWFNLGDTDTKAVYEAKAAVPTPETDSLYRHHREYRDKVEQYEERYKGRSGEAKIGGIRVPLPADAALKHLAESSVVTIHLARS